MTHLLVELSQRVLDHSIRDLMGIRRRLSERHTHLLLVIFRALSKPPADTYKRFAHMGVGAANTAS